MLLTYIAEIADEPLLLEPTDRYQEVETNTWWLSTEDADRRSLSVPEVVAAFERTADALRARVHAAGHSGAATFYVWHDEQADQLRCSTGSVDGTELPFDGAHLPSDDLAPVVAGYLANRPAGPAVPVGPAPDGSPEPEADLPPLLVWVRSIGTPAP
ncbi:hypothetical protein OH807_35160 [Kitasatospora sp. NBC_01560]|uniref:hypothetical protein n=1 Tax=Kitasatospora sp. NBC_01560 TaxID=2975965 RepID=UPI003864D281